MMSSTWGWRWNAAEDLPYPFDVRKVFFFVHELVRVPTLYKQENTVNRQVWSSATIITFFAPSAGQSLYRLGKAAAFHLVDKCLL